MTVTIDGKVYPNATVTITTHVTTTVPTTPTTPTPAPTTPSKPAASATGTTISKVGQTLVDDAGNTYGFTAVPGQITLTPFGKTEFTVSSSGNVVSMTRVAVSSTNPAGIDQTNSAGQIWTVAQTNTAGSYVGQVSTSTSTSPSAPSSGTTSSGSTPAQPVNTSNLNLWTPSKVTSTMYAITDWTKLIANISVEGANDTLTCKIPCPGGHLDWEYNNPEREYYMNPQSDGYNPFQMQSDGSVTIHGEQGSTPNGNQDVRAGCITTAGNQGTLFQGGYGFYACQLKWDLTAGWWPAFWFLSTNNNFQYGLEFDFENWQAMTNNLHCGIANSGTPSTFFSTPDMTAGNQLGIDYQDDNVTFYLNQSVILTVATPANCKNMNIFPIWNTACGRDGSWAGQPAYGGTTIDMNIGHFGAFATS